MTNVPVLPSTAGVPRLSIANGLVIPIPTFPVIAPPDFKKYKFKSGLSAKLVYDINDWFKEIVLVVLINGLENVKVASFAINKLFASVLL